MDRSARIEAQGLLSQGKGQPFDFGAFFTLAYRSTPFFLSRVLSYLPYDTLMWIKERVASKDPACTASHVNWNRLLGPYTVNESLLRDLMQRRRTWVREFGETECLPQSKLISVFDENGTAPLSIFRRTGLDSEFAKHPTFDLGLPAKDIFGQVHTGKRSVIPCLDLFRINFDVFTQGMFRGVEFDGKIAIAGSSVLACLLPLPQEIRELYKKSLLFNRAVRQSLSGLPQDVIQQVLAACDKKPEALLRNALFKHYMDEGSPFYESDIDVFLIVKDFKEAEIKLRKLHDQIIKNIPVPTCVVRTANTISICSEAPYRHVQIVISVCKSIEEHLVTSDLDCVASAYDGSNVYTVPRGIRALNTRTNLVEPADRAQRLYKYARRGFPSVVFELCKHQPRCDLLAGNPKMETMKEEIDRAMKACEWSSRFRGRIARSGNYSDFRLPYGKYITAREIIDLVEQRIERWGQARDRHNRLREEFTRERNARRAEKLQRRKELEMELEEGEILRSETSTSSESDIEGDADFSEELKLEVAYTLDELLEPASMHIVDPEETWTPLPLPKMAIPFRWKYETCKHFHKPATRVQPLCYICNKIIVTQNADTSSTVGPTAVGGNLKELTSNELGLCDACEEKNLKHKNCVANLSGKIALVTGGRIKIGYETALKLVRCGAVVIVVTRFPRDAARRFFAESDSPYWRDRLHIYGVDLRHLGMVSGFINHVKKHYERLDILINNAAQTVRRPPAYYRSLCKREVRLPDDGFWIGAVVKRVDHDPWVIDNDDLEQPNNMLEIESALRSFSLVNASQVAKSNSSNAIVLQSLQKFSSVAASAVLTQLPLVPTDVMKDPVNFPKGQLDMYGEQLDLRRNTSWIQKVDTVDPVEVAEVQLVNSVVPFMFVSQLTDLLSKFPDPAFIVNVSSPEGQFAGIKTGEHVHTNMAKAALNMMTLSASQDLALKNIYVTSVDTGWVSRMRPGTAPTTACPPPLNLKDGAARVLHPVFEGIETGKPMHGVFLRNFAVASW